MALIIVFDIVTNRILQNLPSASSPDFAGRADVVINPNLSALSGVPQKYWKHSSGLIIEMTVGEKATVDSDLAVAATSSMRTGGKAIVDAANSSGIIQRAFSDIVKDEINILRQWLASFKVEVAAATNLADLKTRVATLPSTPDRTLTQLRTAMQNRIDSGLVDL